VHTDHGDVPVEKVEVGDEVVSRNRATGKLESQPVTSSRRRTRIRSWRCASRANERPCGQVPRIRSGSGAGTRHRHGCAPARCAWKILYNRSRAIGAGW
jgi:hypothetical protein